jgi:uncharacterized protein
MEHGTLVEWREWGEDSFRAAQEQDKPILLDIGAVWCHWCHVMDTGIAGDRVHTGTYSNPQVAALINERFIPIKVDNDRRPDINARYNMGGWPTTAFLTPTGEPLYGETYVAPDRMLGLLGYVSDYYKSNRDEIAARLAEHDAEQGQVGHGTLTAEIVDAVGGAIRANFDGVYGGFGAQPKFPHSDAIAFALYRYSTHGDSEMRVVAEKTLDAMAGGGMYDGFAGGFFRYSTTRDWSIPHYEKMLEDNALLSKVYLQAARVLGDPGYADIAKEVHSWLADVMYDSNIGAFAGSQDADKEEGYYGLPLADRAELPTPFIDRTVYTNWNALLVSSFAERYRLFQEPEVLATAVRTYDFIKSRVWPRHFYADGSAKGEEYLIGDVNPMLGAALDLAEVADESEPYLADAVAYASVLLTHLQDGEQGGFFDLKPAPGALGALSRPKKEISADSAAASGLLRLYALAGDNRYLQAAEAALKLYATEYGRYSFFAASYGQAVAQFLSPPAHVVIVGAAGSAEANELRSAVWKTGSPIALEMRSPERAGEYPADPKREAVAYLCAGVNCTVAASAPDLAARIVGGIGNLVESSSG